MKTIQYFQNENDLCLEREVMMNVNGGKAAGESQTRESYFTRWKNTIANFDFNSFD